MCSVFLPLLLYVFTLCPPLASRVVQVFYVVYVFLRDS